MVATGSMWTFSHFSVILRWVHFYSHHESVGVCFYRRWFVFVCLFVTTITKKIVDGFVPNFTGRFLGGSLCFVTMGRGMW